MTYIVRNVDVLDTKPSTGVGIKVPFDGPTGINTTYTTKEAIKSNLLNFILTGKRERVFNPSFGSGVRELLFEPITEDIIDQIDNLIRGGVESYFPTVEIRELEVTLQPDSHTFNIYLNYSVINTNIEDELQINLNNG
jgi:phage baseplate assembly protein W|tara:strand:- start:6694 stop:7107 length:414 start_codon:yes stop_codon:yes gene_type:complete